LQKRQRGGREVEEKISVLASKLLKVVVEFLGAFLPAAHCKVEKPCILTIFISS
jgi:hypothetical protein